MYRRNFWKISNQFLGNLYVSRLVTIAGIRGACPAGGCCLALCCDYRILTDPGYIGLNEVALGISVPKYWGRLMERVIGSGKAEKLLQFAQLVKAKQALDIGLVDEICHKEDLEDAVCKKLRYFTSFSATGRAVGDDRICTINLCSMQSPALLSCLCNLHVPHLENKA
jgi:enoyl-CoA hydratase/carnithine racemase